MRVMRWAGFVSRIDEMRNAFAVLFGKCQGTLLSSENFREGKGRCDKCWGFIETGKVIDQVYIYIYI
jgi:hypothetical protein